MSQCAFHLKSFQYNNFSNIYLAVGYQNIASHRTMNRRDIPPPSNFNSQDLEMLLKPVETRRSNTESISVSTTRRVLPKTSSHVLPKGDSVSNATQNSISRDSKPIRIPDRSVPLSSGTSSPHSSKQEEGDLSIVRPLLLYYAYQCPFSQKILRWLSQNRLVDEQMQKINVAQQQTRVLQNIRGTPTLIDTRYQPTKTILGNAVLPYLQTFALELQQQDPMRRSLEQLYPESKNNNHNPAAGPSVTSNAITTLGPFQQKESDENETKPFSFTSNHVVASFCNGFDDGGGYAFFHSETQPSAGRENLFVLSPFDR